MIHSFVLSPKSVTVDSNCWRVYPTTNSRFLQKAEFLAVKCRKLQIPATFGTTARDKDAKYSILYAKYSVLYFFKFQDLQTPAETQTGKEVSLPDDCEPLPKGIEVTVSLSQEDGKIICSGQAYLSPDSLDLIKQEGEEWLALEVGTFQSSTVCGDITANLQSAVGGPWKISLVFAGVEIRGVSRS
ncbi:uncharacterized protein LOC126410275 [Nymphaea colorata]|nr:uncharacterized protein LOC126410275 [Nymphaea colorata]